MANQEQGTGIKLDARAYPISEPKSSTVAFASVTINDMFAVRGIKVVSGENGIFAAIPSMKDGKGGYQDVCFPTTKELRAEINSAVVGAYNAALEKGAQEKTSVHDQIKDGANTAKEKPTAKTKTAEKAAKKNDPAL